MKLRIDKENDIVRLLLTEQAIEESVETENGIIIDYDADGNLVGLEFLNAARTLGDLGMLQERSQQAQGHAVPSEWVAA